MNVVFLHALPLDPRMWTAQRERFGGEAPDLYSLGRSTDEWAKSVLDSVEGQLVAVGCSMGGYCGCAIARLAPERLSGLVLVASRADADPPERRPVREAWIERVRQRGAEGLWEEMGPKVLAPGADPELVERVRSLALEQDPDGLVRAIEAIRDRPDSTEAVTRLQAPLLVLAGGADELIPRDVGQQLAASAPLGRFHEFEGAGHLPNLERPAEFDGLVAEFLESL